VTWREEGIEDESRAKRWDRTSVSAEDGFESFQIVDDISTEVLLEMRLRFNVETMSVTLTGALEECESSMALRSCLVGKMRDEGEMKDRRERADRT
jgi:uncharacterized membrane protein